MTMQEFTRLIEIYGANPDRWPLDICIDAQKFMETHPKESRKLIEQESKLDKILDEAHIQADVELLQRRILKQVDAFPQEQPIIKKSPGWMAVAAMLVTAFTVGVIGGRSLPNTVPATEPASEEFLTVEFETAADDLGLSDIYAWVEGEDL